MGEVVSLGKYRELKNDYSSYKSRVLSMDKILRLEEMVKYYELYEASDKNKLLTLKGIFLFSVLEREAETDELRILVKSWKSKLEKELTV